MAELKRASVLAIKEETTVGELIAPTAGSDFIPLRAGYSLSATNEELASDELLNDIGVSKSQIGLPDISGSHPAYLKHSEVEGQAPEILLLWESALGTSETYVTEYDVVGGSTAGTASAAATLVVDTGEGAFFDVGQAVLIKDGTNGYSIRNVASIATDTLTLNFNLDAAPASGVDLGKCIAVRPVATGHPSFSVWEYGSNGGFIQAAAGCKVNTITATLPAAEQAEVEFSYAGTDIFFNPVIVTATTKYIDFVDDGGTKVAILDEDIYKSPVAFAASVEAKMNAASVDVITVVYDSQTGKYTLSSDGTTFSLLWNTGANTANSAATKLGDTTAADRTGATTYLSTNAMTLSTSLTPAFDDATNLVVKGAQLFVGTFSDNICRETTTATVTIGVEQENVLSFCAASGLSEKIAVSREVTIEATMILQKYEAHLFDKFVNNTDVAVMLNVGSKDSAGNWIPGKNVNFYMPQASLTQHEVGGDTIVELTITAKGYVTSTRKDLYVNFI